MKNSHRFRPHSLLSRRHSRPPAVCLLVALAALSVPSQLAAGNGVWTPIGPVGAHIRSLVGAGGVLFAATDDGVMVSRNGGRLWHSAKIGDNPLRPSALARVALALDPERPYMVYAAGVEDVYRTIDGGAAWRALRFPCPGAIDQIVIAPSRPRTLYVTSIAEHQPFYTYLGKSTNRGASWSCFFLGDGGVLKIAVDPGDPDTLYLAGGGIYRTTDNGSSFSRVAPASDSDFDAIAFDPTAPRTIYAAGEARVGKSTDGGRTWRPFSDGFPPFSGSVRRQLTALLIDPDRPSTLYTGAPGEPSSVLSQGPGFEGIGVFVSTDAGVTWAHISRGLPRIAFNGMLAFDHATRILYAGTFGHGVYAFTPATPEKTGDLAGSEAPAAPRRISRKAGSPAASSYWLHRSERWSLGCRAEACM
jgi:hypothetical protein